MTKRLFILLILLLVNMPAVAQIVVDTAWVRRYNGPGNNQDEATDLVVDDVGNVYVTGFSYGSETNMDFATIKYYANGDTAWIRRYNREGNYWDAAYAITVDGSSNVYVAGSSRYNGTGLDYATIKYYPNGATAWVRRYNGSGDSTDYATAITIDDFGNVYVTGWSYGSGSSEDYATIKYDALGNELWVTRYNGSGNDHDRAYAIAIDSSGNVYVTGFSHGGETYLDYATIKYYPNGDTAWVRRYNGPANSSDRASDITVDVSGNVYVTGVSLCSETSYDYATIKYHPNGDTAWIRSYNGPGNYSDRSFAIALDGSGNVYVTGYSYGSGTSEDYATIKYDSLGNELWVRRYNGQRNGYDGGYDIAVGGSGYVYVTGVIHGSGYGTFKYDQNGDELWMKTYTGNFAYDEARVIAVDAFENVSVTGYSWGSETHEDYATVKYVQFFRGDCDKDGSIGLVDVILLANYVLKGGPPPDPLQSGDVNCDGKYDLVDVILLARYVLLGQPLPC